MGLTENAEVAKEVISEDPQTSTVSYDDRHYEIVREGLAEILNEQKPDTAKPGKTAKRDDAKTQAVFYNPIQQFNRDLSVLAIRIFGEDLAIIRKARHERRIQRLGQAGSVRRMRKEKASQAQRVNDGSNGASTCGNEGPSPSITNSEVMGNGEMHAAATTDNQNIEVSASVAENSRDSSVSEAVHDIVPAARGDQAQPKRKRIDSSADPEDSADAHRGLKKQKIQDNASSELEDINQPLPLSSEKREDVGPEEINPGGAKTSHEYTESTEHSGHSTSANANHGFSKDEPIRILDGLSATGLRAMRYAKELPFVTSITANDLSPSATASIRLNVRHNNISEKVHTMTGNAMAHMYSVASEQSPRLPGGGRGKYDVIDLDPYGTAAPFLDAAVQALSDGGMLCITCTDCGVFASVGYLEKTFSQYGGLPFKGPPSHEGGLRLILHAVATSAARYGLAIEPLLSLSIDFYARIFVRVRRSPAEVKFLGGKTMIVYNCDEGCGAWKTQFLAENRAQKDKRKETFYKYSLAQAPSAGEMCVHCGLKTHLSGPMWGGPLHNPHFIERMLDSLPSLSKEVYGTIPRMEGMLTLALDEMLEDPSSQTCSNAADSSTIPAIHPATRDHCPFFFTPSTLAKVLHCLCPPEAALRGALMHLGYRITRSHTKPGALRTNAPWSVLWEIMREWVRQKSPIKAESLKKGTAGWGIMKGALMEPDVKAAKVELQAALDISTDLQTMKTEIEAALYRVTKTRIDANPKDINDNNTPAQESAYLVIHPSKLNVVFDERLGRESVTKKIVRYQINPRADWGPMHRASSNH